MRNSTGGQVICHWACLFGEQAGLYALVAYLFSVLAPYVANPQDLKGGAYALFLIAFACFWLSAYIVQSMAEKLKERLATPHSLFMGGFIAWNVVFILFTMLTILSYIYMWYWVAWHEMGLNLFMSIWLGMMLAIIPITSIFNMFEQEALASSIVPDSPVPIEEA